VSALVCAPLADDGQTNQPDVIVRLTVAGKSSTRTDSGERHSHWGKAQPREIRRPIDIRIHTDIIMASSCGPSSSLSSLSPHPSIHPPVNEAARQAGRQPSTRPNHGQPTFLVTLVWTDRHFMLHCSVLSVLLCVYHPSTHRTCTASPLSPSLPLSPPLCVPLARFETTSNNKMSRHHARSRWCVCVCVYR